ncbi:MAG: cysteine--tRNA ligase [bacterium]|nr:cysteine--tRNA ligase [bacterium]
MRIPFWHTLRYSFGRKTPVFLYNTLGAEKQEFTLPASAKTVRMYNCGPTVYDTQHIGNLSMFVFTDTIRKVLEYNNFKVKQVINITDVGHLTSDSDEGEDKMTKGLEREGRELTLQNMLELGERYTNTFLGNLRELNINTEHIIFPRASGYVPAQIAMVATLVEKGFAYKAPDGIYFDTARYPAYGALGGIQENAHSEGARVAANKHKHSQADFALWKFSASSKGGSSSGGKGGPASGGNILGWDSPWGKGFPGWHIECSAMARAVLGEQIDIHTGGIEHIPIHHNNEIAQSECATGRKPFSRFWIHRAHIQIESKKIAKSVGNVIYLSDIIARGFHPISFRYLLLGAHYRTPLNFSWEALSAAEKAYLRLRLMTDNYPAGGEIHLQYQKRMRKRFNDDLDTAGALGVLWEMVRDNTLSHAQIRAGIMDADKVLGLNLGSIDEKATAACIKQFGKKVELAHLPDNVQAMIDERNIARAEKSWEQADLLRKNLEGMGYILEDSAKETTIFRK